MKEVRCTFVPCLPCARLMADRGVIAEQPMRAAAANQIYVFASPDRWPLDGERRPGASAIYRDLRRHRLDPSDLPALWVDDEVAPVYRPFVPCGSCQSQLAEFMACAAVFLSPALKARLAPFVNTRRGKLSKAAKDEVLALMVAAFPELDRALEPMLQRPASTVVTPAL